MEEYDTCNTHFVDPGPSKSLSVQQFIKRIKYWTKHNFEQIIFLQLASFTKLAETMAFKHYTAMTLNMLFDITSCFSWSDLFNVFF